MNFNKFERLYGKPLKDGSVVITSIKGRRTQTAVFPPIHGSGLGGLESIIASVQINTEQATTPGRAYHGYGEPLPGGEYRQ